MKKLLVLLSAFGFIPQIAQAHCPLCTAGAGALALLAASLGVSSVVVGILIGAFALALALWIAPLVKKRFIPYQRQALALLVFIGTVVPIMPLIRDYDPLYLSLYGEYGTLFHNTYTINLFLVGVGVGTVIMFITPYISRLVTRVRERQLPYQGIMMTLIFLVVASVVAQLLS